MLLWGFWVLVALADPSHPGSSLVLSVAVIAAALLIVFLVPRPAPAGASGAVAFARRARTAALPRLIDPDAAGRPRPRAPSACPAA